MDTMLKDTISLLYSAEDRHCLLSWLHVSTGIFKMSSIIADKSLSTALSDSLPVTGNSTEGSLCLSQSV